MRTPSTALSALGLTLPPVADEPEHQHPNMVDAGNRLLVGPVFPYGLPAGPVPRLSSTENVTEKTGFEELPEGHPIRLAFLAVRLTTLRMLSHVATEIGGLDEIRKCLRVQVALRAGPNFRRLGLVALPAERIHQELFGTAPVVSVLGVGSLPGGASMQLEAEYLLNDV